MRGRQGMIGSTAIQRTPEQGLIFAGVYPCFDLDVVKSCHQPRSRNDVIRRMAIGLLPTDLEIATVLAHIRPI